MAFIAPPPDAIASPEQIAAFMKQQQPALPPTDAPPTDAAVPFVAPKPSDIIPQQQSFTPTLDAIKPLPAGTPDAPAQQDRLARRQYQIQNPPEQVDPGFAADPTVAQFAMGVSKAANKFASGLLRVPEAINRTVGLNDGADNLKDAADYLNDTANQIGVKMSKSTGYQQAGWVGEQVGNLAPYMLSGPLAPALIGGQVFGNTYQAAKDAAKKSDPTLTESELNDKALLPAWLTGLGSAISWLYLPKIGGTGAIGKDLLTDEAQAPLKDTIITTMKHMGATGVTAIADKLQQGIVDKATFNPNLPVKDIITDALTDGASMAALSGILGTPKVLGTAMREALTRQIETKYTPEAIKDIFNRVSSDIQGRKEAEAAGGILQNPQSNYQEYQLVKQIGDMLMADGSKGAGVAEHGVVTITRQPKFQNRVLNKLLEVRPRATWILTAKALDKLGDGKTEWQPGEAVSGGPIEPTGGQNAPTIEKPVEKVSGEQAGGVQATARGAEGEVQKPAGTGQGKAPIPAGQVPAFTPPPPTAIVPPVAPVDDKKKPTLFRGTTIDQWQAIQRGETPQSEFSSHGLTWATTDKDSALAYSNHEGKDKSVLIQYKQSAHDKVITLTDDPGDKRRQGKLTLDDVEKVYDGDGNVIYDASKPAAKSNVAPVRFHQVTNVSPGIHWFEVTAPLTAPDGSTYKPGAFVSNGQLAQWGFNVPPAEGQKAQDAAAQLPKQNIDFQGLNIAVENPHGSIRSGYDATGKPWSVKMQHPYGFIQSVGPSVQSDRPINSGATDVQNSSNLSNAVSGIQKGLDPTEIIRRIISSIATGNTPLTKNLPQGTLVNSEAVSDLGAVQSIKSHLFSLFKIPSEGASADVNSKINKVATDWAAADSYFFSNVSNADAIRAHGFDSLDINRQRLVQAHVLSAIKNAEVGRGVMQLLPVNMVNMLIGKDASTNSLASNYPVFWDRLAVDFNNPVSATKSRIINELAARLPASLVLGVAKEISKSGELPRNPIKPGTAKGAVGVSHGSDSGIIKPLSKDKEPVDIYLGPNPNSDRVFVFDQHNPETGKHDEHKSFAGFDSPEQAADAYHHSFSDGSAEHRFGAAKEMTVQEFKDWLADKKQTQKPIASLRPKQPASAPGAVRVPPLEKGQHGISFGQALALHGGNRNLLPKPGETKPQLQDTSGEYFVGQTNDGRFFTEQRPKSPAAKGPVSSIRPKKPKVEAPKPLVKEKDSKFLGFNAAGNQVFEDENGVRSYVEKGIKVTESVEIVPTRSGVETRPPAVHKPEFEVKAQVVSVGGDKPAPVKTPADKTEFVKATADNLQKGQKVRHAPTGKDLGTVKDFGSKPPSSTILVNTSKGGKYDAQHLEVVPGEKPAEKPKTEVKSPLANLSADDLAEFEKLEQELIKKLGQTNISVDPEVALLATRMAGLYAKGGVKSFEQFAKNVKERMPTLWERIKAYLRAAWNQIADLMNLDDVSREQADAVFAGLEKTSEKASSAKVADWVKSKLNKEEAFTGKELFEQSDAAFGGTQGEAKYTPKDAYDAMELGVNQFIADDIRFKIDWAGDPAKEQARAIKAVEQLKRLVSLLPTQTKRTAEMDEFQQFSTPPPLAYVVAWVANIHPSDVVLEPSAGIGGIAVFAKSVGAKTIVNELSQRRAELLKQMGFSRVFTENGEQLNNILPDDIKPTVVTTNPPFSATAGRMQGKRDTSMATLHLEQDLARLEPGGRLVAIVGEGMAADRPAFKLWWKQISQKYHVLANIGISGDEYKKYGTTFGNQIVVIDKPLPNEVVGLVSPKTGQVQKIEELIPLLEETRYERKRTTGAVEPAGDKPDLQEIAGEGEAATRPNPTPPVSTGGVGTGSAKPGSGKPGKTAATGGPSLRKRPQKAAGVSTGERPGTPAGERPAGDRPSEVEQPAPSGESNPSSPEPARTGGDSLLGQDLSVKAAEAAEAKDLEVGSVFENYRPQVAIQGAKPHPTPLAESAAMSSVKYPHPKYKPALPAELLTSGALSDAQMESVLLAGAAHGRELTDGRRRGFFIGDGTGVGKGRQNAAILFDNFNQGRKKGVWITADQKLFPDAQRDLEGVGWKKDVLFPHKKVKNKEPIEVKQGVLFTAYSLLRNENRLKQIVDWLGKDFDGVIIFDESHKMANAVETKGARGKKPVAGQALAGIDLQAKLPKARIVYVSATGATEVSNLAYAERLGIWGDGTPFPNRDAFIQNIGSRGVGAMEIVAKDLKSMGAYVSRNLSFDGVTYEQLEHPLNPDQRKMYDMLAGAWQMVLNHMEDALAVTQADSSAQAKSAARSAFWGAHQRFFNQLLTSLQMPTVLESIKKHISNGDSVVLQLVNTNESQMERAISKATEAASEEEEPDLETLDITPRETLIQYVENAFPVDQFEEYIDDNGNTRSRPVLDSKGNRVKNAEAVKMREDLINKLASVRVPVGALDEILETFGEANVAEVTGRTRRVVTKDTPEGKKKVIENRTAQSNLADRTAFNDDKKKILVFSDAGGTGASYHADRNFKNQRKRQHMVLQPGWRADNAIQGLGRSHRSNQNQPPHFVLASTDVPGHKRFVSTIARRIEQLGALTKGQRQTTSQGIFNARDNLESTYARESLRAFLRALGAGRIQDIDVNDFAAQTGLKMFNDDGVFIGESIQIGQFLNRLLSLSLDMQEKVFGAFSSQLDATIEWHKRNGTLDVGMETLVAQATKLTRERPIYTDAETGAVTNMVELEQTHPTTLVKWSDMWLDDKETDFVTNTRSGMIWKLGVVQTRATSDGKNESFRLATNPRNGHGYLKTHEIAMKFSPVEKADAKKIWDETFSKAPATYTQPVTLLTGTLLPVWDRIPAFTRIARAQDDAGRRYLGVIIHQDMIPDVEKNFGLESKIELSPQQAIERVMDDGAALVLSNGWRIVRRYVSGEQRMEISGPDYRHQQEMERNGVIMERIQYSMRYFIPTNGDQALILSRVIKSRPIVEVSGGDGRKGSIGKGDEVAKKRAAIVADYEKKMDSEMESANAGFKLDDSDAESGFWSAYSSTKGNDRGANISKRDDGRFEVRDENDSSLGIEKTFEDAVASAKDHINAGGSEKQWTLDYDTRQEILNTIAIPSDMVLKDVQDTKWESVYYKVEKVLSRDEDGEPDNTEEYKLSIRNHEPSPFRETEFGASDYWVEVPKGASPQQLSDAVAKIEGWLKRRSDSQDASRYPVTKPANPTAPVSAKSVEELKALLEANATGLNTEQAKLIGEFLKSKLAAKLPALRFFIADALDGGLSGSYLDRLIEIARGADAEAGPHEFLHAVWEILPADIKAELGRMRRRTIEDMLADPETDALVKPLLQDLLDNPIRDINDWNKRNIPDELAQELYPLSSDEEYFTNSGSAQFKAKVGSEVEGFWSRVKEIIKDLIAALRKALRLSQSQEQLLRNILNGNFTVTPETAATAEANAGGRKGSIIKTEGEADDAEGGVPLDTTQVMGKDMEIGSRPHITADSTERSVQHTRSMLALAAIPHDIVTIPDDRRGGKPIELAEFGQVNDDDIRRLTELVKKDFIRHEEGAQATDLNANLIRSIQYNINEGKMPDVSLDVRRDLDRLVTSETSRRGMALGALAQHSVELLNVAHDPELHLSNLYHDAFGGDAYESMMKRVAKGMSDVFSDEEIAAILKKHPDLQEIFDEADRRRRLAAGDRVYRSVQAQLKPEAPLSEQKLKQNALIREAVREILQQAEAEGIKPKTRPGAKALSPIEQLALMTTPETAGIIDRAISKSVRTAERNAARALYQRENDSSEEEMQNYDQRTHDPTVEGPDPTPDQVEKGLDQVQFKHWRVIRDNLIGYDPITVKLAQDIIKGDFKGTKFSEGKPKEKQPDNRISLTELAKSPDSEVERQLDSYYSELVTEMEISGASEETRSRVRQMIEEKVAGQLEARRAQLREPMFQPPRSATESPTQEQRLAAQINAGLFRDPRLDIAEYVHRVASKSLLKALTPSVNDLMKQIMDTTTAKQGNIKTNFINAMAEKLNLDSEQEANVRKVFEAAIEPRLKDAREKAIAAALKSMTPKEYEVMPLTDKRLWKKIRSFLNAGGTQAGELLKQIAEMKGFKPPSQADIDRLKELPDKIEELSTLTEAERARIESRAGLTDEEKAKEIAAKTEQKIAVNSPDLNKLWRKMGAKWSEFARPINFLSPKATAANIAAATMEVWTAGALAKFGFPFRLGYHIVVGLVSHHATRPLGIAWAQYLEDSGKGLPTHFVQDAASALRDTFKQTKAAIVPALHAMRAEFAGRGQVKQVDAMLASINVLARAEEKADEYFKNGDYSRAALFYFYSLLKYSQRTVTGLDAAQREMVEYPEMRHRMFRELAAKGLDRVVIEQNIDKMFSNMTDRMMDAMGEAKMQLDEEGKTVTEADLITRAERLMKVKLWQEMEDAGFVSPTDRDYVSRKSLFVSWQEAQTQGVGGAVGKTMQAWRRAMADRGIPIPMLFVHAISNGINMTLRHGPLYALADGKKANWQRSSATERPEDRMQNRVRAILGTLLGSIAVMLVLSRKWKVQSKYPADKEERARFIEDGHRIGMVEILHDDGSFTPISLTVGFLQPISPFIAAAGSLVNAQDRNAKEQARLNAKAAKLGLLPGKAKTLGSADILAAVGSAFWTHVMGTATTSGMAAGYSEFGSLNVNKSIASIISPTIPFLPAYQEISRMMGISMDKDLASVWDYMLPRETSGARLVNALGDPVKTTDDLQRIVQVITAGSLLGSVHPTSQGNAYDQMFNNNWNAPSINPGKGYAIDGEFRPMTTPELENYTVKRGEYLKEALSALAPDATRKDVQAAYAQANARALADVGVTPTGRISSSGRSMGETAASGASGAQSGVGASPASLGGYGASSGGSGSPSLRVGGGYGKGSGSLRSLRRRVGPSRIGGYHGSLRPAKPISIKKSSGGVSKSSMRSLRVRRR